jgi:hypothetical protein
MRTLSRLKHASNTVKYLFVSLQEENLNGLIPIMILVLALAVILVCLKLSSPIAPFVYSLF